ncbi:unnamed protein product [Schistosoma intercalatum]|nr:unnamed protein product [Schistosoma intercalatum]
MINSMLIMIIVSLNIYIKCTPISNNIWTLKQNTGSFQSQDQVQTFNTSGYSIQKQSQTQSFINPYNNGQQIIQQQIQQQNQQFNSIQSQAQHQSINSGNLQPINTLPMINQPNQNDGLQIPIDQTQQPFDSQIYNQPELPSQSQNDVGHSIPDHHQQQEEQSTEIPQEYQDSEIQRTQRIQNETNSQQLDSSPQSDQSQSNVDGLTLVQPPLSEQFRAIQNGENQSSQQSQPGIDSQRQPDSSPQSDQSQSNVDGLTLVQPPLSEQFRAIQNGENQSSQQSQPGIDSQRQSDSSPQSDQSQSNVDGLMLVQPPLSEQFRAIQNGENQSSQQSQPGIDSQRQPDSSPQSDQSQSNVDGLTLVQPPLSEQFRAIQNGENQSSQQSQPGIDSQRQPDSSPQSDQSQSNVDGLMLVQPPLSEQFRAIQNGENQSSQQSQPGIDSQRQSDSSPQSDQSQSNVDGLMLVQPPLSEQFRAIQNGENQSSQQSQPGIDSQRQPDSSPQSDQSQSNVDGLTLVQPPLSEQFRAIQNGENQSSQQSQPGIDSQRQPDSSPQSDQSQSNVDGLMLVQPPLSEQFRAIQNGENQSSQQSQPGIDSQRQSDSSPQSDQSQSNVDGLMLVQPPLSEQFRAIQNGENQSSQQSQPGIDSQRQPDSSPQSDQSQSNVDGLTLVQPPLSEQFRAIQNGENQSSQQSQPGIDSQRQPDSSPQSDQSQSNVDGLMLVQPPLSEQFRAIQNGENQSSQQSQPGIDSQRQSDSSPQSDQSQSNVDGLMLVQPQSSDLFQVSDSLIPNVSNPIVEQHSEFDNSFSSEPTQSLESHLSPDSPLSDQQHQ